MENIFYVNYNNCIEISFDALIVAMWNTYVETVERDKKISPNNKEFFENSLENAYVEAEAAGRDKKISLNNKEFFENSFDDAYDAAMAISWSGRWRWTDSFVYFDEEGYLTSFSRLDDENSPIDMDKIDIDYLIRALQDLQRSPKKWHKKGCVNNIPRAIHDALQE